MKSHIYANGSKEIRYLSSSGGFFSYLADKTLACSGIVIGAVWDDDLTVRHTVVKTTEGVERLRKSKYVFSDTGDIFRQAEAALGCGRQVLFTGCPCQVAALKKYLRHDYDNLLCAEVVCHGAPQKVAWQRYLEELLQQLHRPKQDISNIDFRDKSTGWDSYSFTISFNDGTKFTERATC